mgnify:CR=1 FL=1
MERMIMAKPRKSLKLDEDVWEGLKTLSVRKRKPMNGIVRELVFGEGFALSDFGKGVGLGASFGIIRPKKR